MAALFKQESIDKYIELAKLGSGTALIQLLVKLLGFCSSILIIRWLPQQEYSYYTIAYTFLGVMTVLGDSGISNGVMAAGGKVWTSPEKLGRVIATGLHLRRQFALFVAISILPIFVLFLYRMEASANEIAFLCLALLPLFYLELSQGLLRIAPKLSQTLYALQRVNLASNLLRLALTIPLLLIVPYAAVILLGTSLATAWDNYRVRKINDKLCDRSQQPDPEIRSEVLAVTRRVLPGSFYFCISGALSVWLISIFGESSQVAEVGALNRVAHISVVAYSVIALVLVPRFSRMDQADPKLRRRFVEVLALSAAIAAIMYLLFYVFSKQIIFVLGSGYEGLTYELRIRALVMCVGLNANIALALTSARGWIVHPAILIPGEIVTQAVGIAIFGCSTVAGVILITLLPITFKLIITIYYAFYRMSRSDRSIA